MADAEIPDDLDSDKLAEVALGLLALTLHDGCRPLRQDSCHPV